jgi:Zn-dependent peptidase ImmA (M78 family)/transcriptional regulator with XRE-family HTH domain
LLYNLVSMLRLEANPTPSVLVWARTSSGLSPTEAAKKIDVAAERLLAWETGTEKPSFAQLRKAAKAYKRPIAVFYLKEPPKGFSVMRDFRRRSGGESVSISTQLMQEIRRASDRRDWALQLMAELDERPKELTRKLSLTQEIEDAATQVRAFLGVTTQLQSQWRQQAFSQWRSHIERAGILTFEMTSVAPGEASGFSIGARPLPAAVANIKDSRTSRIFTLLHEVTHILLESDGICDLEERGHDDLARTESFCNRVAGAAIFPREAMLSLDAIRLHQKGQPKWTDEELRTIASQFGGSREAALVRLATLGLTSRAFCDSRRLQFQKEYEQVAEARKNQAVDGFAPPHQLELWSAGPMFVSLVVENLNRDRITASDFSDYLQIRTKHIAEVQQEYAGFEQ